MIPLRLGYYTTNIQQKSKDYPHWLSPCLPLGNMSEIHIANSIQVRPGQNNYVHLSGSRSTQPKWAQVVLVSSLVVTISPKQAI